MRVLAYSLISIFVGSILGAVLFFGFEELEKGTQKLGELENKAFENKAASSLSRKVVELTPKKEKKVSLPLSPQEAELLAERWKAEALFLQKVYQVYAQCLAERKLEKGRLELQRLLAAAPTPQLRMHVITVLHNLSRLAPLWERKETSEKGSSEGKDKKRPKQKKKASSETK